MSITKTTRNPANPAANAANTTATATKKRLTAKQKAAIEKQTAGGIAAILNAEKQRAAQSQTQASGGKGNGNGGAKVKAAATPNGKRRKSKSDTPAPNGNEKITAQNVERIARAIAIKALKTVIDKAGGSAYAAIYNLQNGLFADCKLIDYKGEKGERVASGVISDGYDVAQTAALFLVRYIGKPLNAPVDGGKTIDKKGQPVTILRACFRAVNRYIMAQRQVAAKVDGGQTLTDYNGLFITAPRGYDVPTYTDYAMLKALITAAKLSPKEKQILSLRLSGKSRAQIVFVFSGLSVIEYAAAMDKANITPAAVAARELLKRVENTTQKQIARMIAKFSAPDFLAAAAKITPDFAEKLQRLASKRGKH